MIDTIYIEEAVLEHPRTQGILQRFKRAQNIVIARYGEVFNSHAQNFRLQKQNPSLVLATKQNKRVLPAPAQYEAGGGANYYFSHMLNCLYDCRYCFLQGMYQSANYLLFVNYEDFAQDIKELAQQHIADAQPPWFFSGYDCDSLAMEPMTGFAAEFLNVFDDIPDAVLELRTKSTQIRSLLARPAKDNVVVAYSLSPDLVAQNVEEGAPSLAKRIEALVKLQHAGWRVGIRFDPVIWHEGFQKNYSTLVEQVFAALDTDKIDSVTLGGFRLPKGYFKVMRKLFPEHWIFSAGLSESESGGGAKMISYRDEIEAEMFDVIERKIKQYFDVSKLYIYRANNELEDVS